MSRRAGLGRALSRGLWYGLPALAVAAVVGYLALVVAWGVYPPLVPVQGTSMRPALVTGDLVLLHRAEPDRLRVGQVVAVAVPVADRQKYGLPAEVVHRIVRVTHGAQGLVFQTKGDANSGPDVFATPAAAVVGRMTGAVPYLGYPVLFFHSRQGVIFLTVAGLVVLGYLVLGWLEARPAGPAGPDDRLAELLTETRELRRQLTAPLPPAEAGPGGLDPAVGAAPDDEGLQTRVALRAFAAAMAEYGEHLRSHTAVMQALATTTADLQRAVAELRSVLAETAADQRKPPTA